MKRNWVILSSIIVLVTSIGFGLKTFDWSGLIAANPTNIVVSEEEAAIKAYDETLPSVVSIVITQNETDSLGAIIEQDTGGGTGFIISSDGYIITNKHVVSDTKARYTAVTSQGKEYAASVLARDPLFDVAIIKIEGGNFKAARLGDSDKIRIGQTVLAIGNVLTEFQNSVTKGIVSGISRIITATGAGITETIEGAIQTDASVNPGNSGGPLVNLKGEVIGINTAINRAGESLGFAIPINRAKQALALYRQHGKILRTFLGVRYVILDRTVAKQYGVNYSSGAYVIIKNSYGDPGVVPNGPAEKAGVKTEDIILEVNKKKISTNFTLAEAISQYKPDDTVTLKILRNGTEHLIPVTLKELPNLE